MTDRSLAAMALGKTHLMPGIPKAYRSYRYLLRPFRTSFACLCVLMFCVTASYAQSESSINIPLNIKPFLQNYCYECHGQKEQKGDMRFDTMALVITNDKSAKTWQEALDTLNASEMPPKKATKHPSVSVLAGAIDELTRGLYEARKQLTTSSSPIIRRLNRREYVNTIEDLLGVRVDPFDLPDDDLYAGFDTIGQAQEMSALAYEQYLNVGKKAIAMFQTAVLPENLTDNRINNKKKRSKYESVRVEPEVAKIKGAAKKLEDGLATLNKGDVDRAIGQIATGLSLQGIKGADTGLLLIDIFTQSLPEVPGRYQVHFRIGMTDKPNGEPPFVCVTHAHGNRLEPIFSDLLGVIKITKEMKDAEMYTFEIERKTDQKEVIILELEHSALKVEKKYMDALRKDIEKKIKALPPKGPFTKSDVTPPQLPPFDASLVWLDWLEIKRIGEIEKTPQRVALEKQLIALCEMATQSTVAPKESDLIRQTLLTFIEMACRGRKPDNHLIENLVQYYAERRAEGMNGAAASAETLAIVLASPSFVYQVETKLPNQAQPTLISDLELANRLSYTLWASPPDQALLRFAAQGELSKPAVLENTVEQMLNDPKANSFINAFTRQWLNLDHLDMVVVNRKKYPQYNENISNAFKEETLSFIAQLMRDNLSVLNIIDSDFVMVNDFLAPYYGLQGDGHEFKKIKLPENSIRGGLLGQGAILTMTSTGERTSPVERGAFVLRKLLGTEPPPPPPNVPQFDVEPNQSVREILAQHAQSAQCASCHQRFDPFGLALEHFDAIGLWRDYEDPNAAKAAKRKNAPPQPTIDVSGKLSNGDTFVGHDGLKKYLMSQKERVARGVMKSMLTYCLGRPVSFSDEALIDDLMNTWKKKNYGMRSLMHIIVSSNSFRSK